MESGCEGTEWPAVIDLNLLFPENAPTDMLRSGAHFEIYEGARRVATGIVDE